MHQAASNEEIKRVVFDEAEIAQAVDRLAAGIGAEYAGQPLLLLGILKGALFTIADLARALHRVGGPASIELDFLAVSSYGNANRSSGEVRLLKDTSASIEGRHVLIVEDIVDNGLTLAYLQRLLGSRAPASLRTCVLLDKPYRRSADVTVDYVGLTVPDLFIVGYGLDYQEKYRTLPFLAELHEWVFAGEGNAVHTGPNAASAADVERI